MCGGTPRRIRGPQSTGCGRLRGSKGAHFHSG
nr:MAG TPA: hypothetical protein [Caudoviricetes sp.]